MSQKVAVLVFQLGGPDSPKAVEPFLYNLFKDPDIIDFPGAFLGRKVLAKVISILRAKKVAHHYDEIGGKSPILELTNQQAHALEARLKSEGVDATVIVAMRYWHPMTDAAIKRIKEGAFNKVILLPLYPQFSQATTYSSMNEWNRVASKQRLNGVPTQLICCYPNHPLMVEAFVDNINKSLQRFGNIPQEDIDILFSAHGVPMEFITNGDPYQLQVEETVRKVAEAGAWKSPHLVCYQSRVGPQQWLGPSLLEAIEERARNGRKNILVAPISFVTEHIETLHEIDMEAREHAQHYGIAQFEMMPALNDHPKFIACLADLVQARLHSRFDPVSKCERLSQEYPGRPTPTLCPWYGKAAQ
ncbi:MAG: ferrochelatase [Ignavibacteriae bacterium]|nr:ferrochelatase [Ignavibacteriota bacterium]